MIFAGIAVIGTTVQKCKVQNAKCEKRNDTGHAFSCERHVPASREPSSFYLTGGNDDRRGISRTIVKFEPASMLGTGQREMYCMFKTR